MLTVINKNPNLLLKKRPSGILRAMSTSTISILPRYSALFFLMNKTPIWVYLRTDKRGAWGQSLRAQMLRVPDLSGVWGRRCHEQLESHVIADKSVQLQCMLQIVH